MQPGLGDQALQARAVLGTGLARLEKGGSTRTQLAERLAQARQLAQHGVEHMVGGGIAVAGQPGSLGQAAQHHDLGGGGFGVPRIALAALDRLPGHCASQ